MDKFSVGQRLSFQSFPSTVRYVGKLQGKDGEWLGIEWDDPSRGKHSGKYAGVRYFEWDRQSLDFQGIISGSRILLKLEDDLIILGRVPDSGSFVRSNRPHDGARSFLQALHNKYVTNITQGAAATPVAFGTKVAEEVGFEKASKKFSNLPLLKFVMLDGMAIDRAEDEGENIAQTSPSVKELDLSRNLFTSLEPVATICSRLSNLTNLRINGNRFASVTLSDKRKNPFVGITDLESESQLLNLEAVRFKMDLLLRNFPNVTNLSLARNSLSQLLINPGKGLFDDLQLATTLRVLSLEDNRFDSLALLGQLQALKNLKHLVLSRNLIETVLSPDGDADLVKLDSITNLDVSNNRIKHWAFLDALGVSVPNLEALRISNNPLYDTDTDKIPDAKADSKYVLTIARLSSRVKTLNYSAITPAQRLDAELYYMSAIAKEIEGSPPDREKDIIQNHPRWQELQKTHGPQDINRNREKVEEPEKTTLGSKLVEIKLLCSGKTFTRRIPRTITISALKGLVGKLFGLRPMNLALQLVEDQDEDVANKAIFLDDFRDLRFYVGGKSAGIQVTET